MSSLISFNALPKMNYEAELQALGLDSFEVISKVYGSDSVNSSPISDSSMPLHGQHDELASDLFGLGGYQEAGRPNHPNHHAGMAVMQNSMHNMHETLRNTVGVVPSPGWSEHGHYAMTSGHQTPVPGQHQHSQPVPGQHQHSQHTHFPYTFNHVPMQGAPSCSAPTQPACSMDFSDSSAGLYTPVASPTSTDHSDYRYGMASAEQQISDNDLLRLPVRELNRLIKNMRVDSESITRLKQRRRTLKNRGYAHNCRQRRQAIRSSLHVQHVSLEKKLVQAMTELSQVKLERDGLKEETEQLRLKLTKPVSTRMSV